MLEDDVRLTADFAPACAAIAALPAGWDMIKLIGRESLGKAEKLSLQRPLCPRVQLVDYRRVPSLTAGYAISRQGAEKLLAARLPFGRPVDVDLRHWWEGRRLRIQGVRPAVIELDETSLESSIGSKMDERDTRIKWRKFRLKLNYTLLNAWQGRRQ